MRGFSPAVNDDERLFSRRMDELVTTARDKGIARATMFLSDRQQSIALLSLQKNVCEDYFFWGGYVGSERAILCINDTQNKADERIVAINICTFTENMLNHRDYLGALLSLGIKRECIGDILVNKAACVAFMLPKAAELAISLLSSVGKENVSLSKANIHELELHYKAPEVLGTTVASLRLDSVLAAMMHISRSEAQELIKAKLVEVNHISIVSVHYEVQQDDVFTVRGKGKYKLCELGGKSRKDRLFINYYQY